MHRIALYIFIVGALAQACQETPTNESADRKNGYEPVLKTKEDSLYHDVMEGHDVGMAKINKIRKYGSRVQQSLDSLKKLPASKLDKQYQQTLIGLQEELNYADISMNKWMEEFKADTLQDNKDLRVQYLQSEKEKVTKVKENILNSLQKADSLFNKQTAH